MMCLLALGSVENDVTTHWMLFGSAFYPSSVTDVTDEDGGWLCRWLELKEIGQQGCRIDRKT